MSKQDHPVYFSHDDAPTEGEAEFIPYSADASRRHHSARRRSRERVRRPELPQHDRVVATEQTMRPRGGLGLLWYRVWHFLIGQPIPSSQAMHQRLGVVIALAVLSSDAISSVAYGPEEIYLQLMRSGPVGLPYGLWIGLAIAALMAIVGFSYRQTIRAYPAGGGSYIVARDNLGTLPGLTAASSLLVDYVLTVAVSVSAGVAAITSAFPLLFGHRVLIALVFILILMLGNLRGIRDSGAIFAAPTYIFIGTLYLLIAAGVGQMALAGEKVVAIPQPSLPVVEGLSIFLILRAFASGCSAMTGMEAIADGVPAFRPPESDHARKTLTWMTGILITSFLGTMLLTLLYHAVPRPDGSETLVSLLAHGIFGNGPFYYLLQAATALILVLAANTSYADFPRLSSILARDRFMPRQFAFRGDRLAFNTGIFALSVLSAVLVIAYQGVTDALIPLYAIGVFVSFTLSQSGMVRRWLRLRTPGWRRALAVNAVGATATGIVTIVTAVAKFGEGAWIVLLLIPIIILGLLTIHRHYSSVGTQLNAGETLPTLAPVARHDSLRILVPMASVNKATLRTLSYAIALSGAVTVLHVAENRDEGDAFRERLRASWPNGRIVVIESPYRALLGPLLAYIDGLHEREPERMLTVVIPEFLVAHWWEHLLHNQTALRLKAALLFREGVAVISVPYHLH